MAALAPAVASQGRGFIGKVGADSIPSALLFRGEINPTEFDNGKLRVAIRMLGETELLESRTSSFAFPLGLIKSWPSGTGKSVFN